MFTEQTPFPERLYEERCVFSLSHSMAQRQDKIGKTDLFQCAAYLICCLSTKYLSAGLMAVQCAVCAITGDPGVTPSEAVAKKIPLMHHVHCTQNKCGQTEDYAFVLVDSSKQVFTRFRVHIQRELIADLNRFL